MKTGKILILAGICIITCNSCLKDILCVEGDRTPVLEIRRISSFDQIKNTTSFDIVYKEADTLGIRISAEQNIMHYIETNVYDDCLEISTSPATVCLDYHEQPVIMVSSPLLKKAVNSGSGSFIADRMTGETVTVKNTGSGDMIIDLAESNDFESSLSGSGDIDIKALVCINTDILISGSGNTSVAGDCETSHYKITGSGSIYGSEMVTSTASIIISGSGSAYTNIEEYLNGLISGSGNIYVKGDPEIDQTLTGSGRIIKIK